MENKKILVLHHSGAIGGGGVSMLHILDSLDRSKYNIKVYCPMENGHMANAIKSMDIDVSTDFSKDYVYPHFNGRIYSLIDYRFIKSIVNIYKSKEKIKEILKDEKPDILVLNSYTLFWIGKIAKELDIATVCFYRETLPKNTPFRNNHIKSQLRKYIDRLCYISNYDKNVVGDDTKSHVIYDRIDVSNYQSQSKSDARKQYNLDNNSKYVLFLGGMWSVKGTHVLVKAMKDVDAKLIMLQYSPSSKSKITIANAIGIKNKVRIMLGADYEANVLNTIDEHDLWDKIIFKDGKQEVWSLYDACDVVVFPSTLPHQSRPFYEAGLAKKPVVISDFINTSEFARHMDTAITFTSGNSNDLADKINYCLSNDMTSIIENNYNESCKQHDLSTLASDIDNMLNGL